jgi:hypothetical protein
VYESLENVRRLVWIYSNADVEEPKDWIYSIVPSLSIAWRGIRG